MIIRKQLENGLRVLLEPMPGYRSVALGVFICAGSGHEDPARVGAAHALEHMLFKGTTHRSAREIADEMTALGTSLDAFTSKESTCYYTRVLGEYAKDALAVIADMVKNPLLDEQDMEKELGVILEEIDMYTDDADDLVHELLLKAIWPDHALGMSISGEKEVVSRFTVSDLRAFHQAHYCGRQLLISAAGALDPEAFMAQIQALFGSIPAGESTPVITCPSYTRQVVLRSRPIEQMHLCIAFPGIPYDHPDKYVLTAVNAILGGNANSRLFLKLREEMGLTYSVYSYGSAYVSGGLLQIYAGMAPEHTADVLDAVLTCIEEMKAHPPDEKECTLIIRTICAELLMGTESTHNRMDANAKSVLYLKHPETISEMIERMQAIRTEDIADFMQRYYDLSMMSFALVGDLDSADPRAVKDVLVRHHLDTGLFEASWQGIGGHGE